MTWHEEVTAEHGPVEMIEREFDGECSTTWHWPNQEVVLWRRGLGWTVEARRANVVFATFGQFGSEPDDERIRDVCRLAGLLPPEPPTDVLAEVRAERRRQDARWGEQNWPDGTSRHNHARSADEARRSCDKAARFGYVTWFHILREEFWEACAEVDPDRLRNELIQVSAVAAAWAEAIDRRKTDTTTTEGEATP